MAIFGLLISINTLSNLFAPPNLPLSLDKVDYFLIAAPSKYVIFLFGLGFVNLYDLTNLGSLLKLY